MYGTPDAQLRPVRSVQLDLPSEIEFISEDPPALYAYGPLSGEDPDLSQYDKIVPAEVAYAGTLAEFTFDEPLENGRFRIYVHASRIRMADDQVKLTREDGSAWNGWELTITDVSNRNGPEPQQPEGTASTTALPVANVYLDGTALPNGATGLSGEILAVETETAADVTLSVEPFNTGASRTLYARYLERSFYETESGLYGTRFHATGPIENFAWALYRGKDTLGGLPISDGRLALATPLLRRPRGADEDPLLDRSVTEVHPQGHPNVYEETSYTVYPETVVPGGAYDARKIVSPKTITDETNTPATNPRLFPDAVYVDEPVTGATKIGAFDLPLNARLVVSVDGQTVWTGYTRVVPALVTPSLVERELGWDVSNAGPLMEKIWSYSSEALRFWDCALPARGGRGEVVPTMQEYVLTRLALGHLREDGFHGVTMVRTGDHQVQGASDRGLRRRLAALQNALKNCTRDAGLFPEDETPGEWAGLASEARPELYPSPKGRPGEEIAPIYDQTRRVGRTRDVERDWSHIWPRRS